MNFRSLKCNIFVFFPSFRYSSSKMRTELNDAWECDFVSFYAFPLFFFRLSVPCWFIGNMFSKNRRHERPSLLLLWSIRAARIVPDVIPEECLMFASSTSHLHFCCRPILLLNRIRKAIETWSIFFSRYSRICTATILSQNLISWHTSFFDWFYGSKRLARMKRKSDIHF